MNCCGFQFDSMIRLWIKQSIALTGLVFKFWLIFSIPGQFSIARFDNFLEKYYRYNFRDFSCWNGKFPAQEGRGYIGKLTGISQSFVSKSGGIIFEAMRYVEIFCALMKLPPISFWITSSNILLSCSFASRHLRNASWQGLVLACVYAFVRIYLCLCQSVGLSDSFS